jgi:hypothetical protein
MPEPANAATLARFERALRVALATPPAKSRKRKPTGKRKTK